MMKTTSRLILVCMALTALAGCGLFSPNHVNMRWATLWPKTKVNDRGNSIWAHQLTFNYAPEYEITHVYNLQHNTTYIFWIGRQPNGMPPGPPIYETLSTDRIDTYRKFELQLFDPEGNLLRYNDEYTENATNDYDTLALIKFRTPENLKIDKAYLKVSMCEDPVPKTGFPFQVHFVSFPTPENITENYAGGKLPPGSALRENEDPIKPDIAKDVRWHGIEHSGHGDGYGLWKEWCAKSSQGIDDNLECMLHNFEPYWFIPDTSGLYHIELTSMDILGFAQAMPDSLALSVFHDSEFRKPNDVTLEDFQSTLNSRLTAICDGMVNGLRHIASGIHRNSSPKSQSIAAGQVTNGQTGVPMLKDSVYYILVSAPRKQFPGCSLKLTRMKPYCSQATSRTLVENPNINYQFPCSLVTKLGKINLNYSNDVAYYSELFRVGMESQWSNHCWYEIAPSGATVYKFEIRSDFPGKISIFDYGDPDDLRTYSHIKSRLFGLNDSGEAEVVRFEIRGRALQRRLRVVVYGHPCDNHAAIDISMVPINLPVGPEQEIATSHFIKSITD